MARLSLSQVQEITEHLADCKLSQNQIAQMYDITNDSISNINSGNTWFREGIGYPIRKRIVRRERPTREELIESLIKDNFPTTYRKYDTSLGVLKRWCRLYGIPDNYQELDAWYRENKK